MRVLICCLLWAFVLFPEVGRASGEPRSFPTFGLTMRPDLPLERFAAGQLGVVRPSWAISYLVVAYRYLAGLPPSSREQEVFLSVWRSRLANAPSAIPLEPRLEVDVSLQDWLMARTAVSAPDAGVSDELQSWKKAPKGYFQFLNCTAGAFDKAAETLKDRVERFGAASGQVKSWLGAQDVVFENCSGDVPEKLPPAALPDDDPLIRFDRSYQIAAARFYAGNFDEAESAFGAIAADAASPWRAWARLALARVLIRRADLEELDEARKAELISRASKDLRAMLADQAMAEVHDGARSLLHIVCARHHDPTAAAFLAEVILHPPDIEELAWAFNSYTTSPYSRHVPDPAMTEDDMTQWIGAVAGQDGGLALARWKEAAAPHWLVAALANADPGDPSLAELLAAARKVPPSSRAWPTVTYHRLRLEPSAGSARRELDALLAELAQSLPVTSYNLFVALRYALAADLDELLRHAPRVPVAILSSEYGAGDATAEGTPLFDKDAADTFNMRLPLAVLVDAVKRPILPRRLRNELARTAWVRAVLLEDHTTARDLAKLLRSLPGAAAPYGLSKDLQAYLSAGSPAERSVAVVLALGRNPGLSPWTRDGFMRKGPPEELGNSYTNWWFNERYSQWLRGRDLAASPGFLRPEERAQAEAEYRKLLSLGNGPTYIGRLAVAAAETLPTHPGVPEVLHRAVIASGVGWGDAETGRWSKAAFTMLHSRFPASAWTKKTPFWYR